MNAKGGVDMVSPTGMTNAIRRPKSPRRPDHRGAVVSNKAYAQRTADGKDPHVRRRSLGEAGHFGSQPDVSQPRMCAPMDVGELLSFNPKAAACYSQTVDTSKEVSRKYGPTAKRNFTTCVGTSAVVAQKAGDGLADFTITAAEAYRQECRSDNRGGDAQFFTDSNSAGFDKSLSTNSVVDTSTVDDIDRLDKPGAEPKMPRSRSASAKLGDQREPTFNHKKAHHPHAIHVEEKKTDLSPPRVDRMISRGFEPKEYRTNSRREGQSNGELREARMDLFRMGEDGTSPEVRLVRALEDMNQQDQMIDSLKKQLRLTQRHLDETFEELQQARSQAQEKQFKVTETRARAVQDRKRLEDSYEEEKQKCKELQDTVSNLQVEVSTLKVSLRGSRSSDGRGQQTTSSVNRSVEKEDLQPSSTQMMTLKAEILDLRSKLAEARAVPSEDTKLTYTKELHDLRAQVQTLEAQVHEEKSVKEILERVQESTEEAKANLAKQLEAKSDAEKQVRSELVKTKAALTRLERERSRNRLHSAADVERLNRKMMSSKEEVAKLEAQLRTERDAFEAQISSLRKELEELKRSGGAGASPSSIRGALSFREKRRLESEVSKRAEELKNMKHVLENKDVKIDSYLRRIEELEMNDELGRPHRFESNPNGFSSHQVAKLEQQVKLHKANEASLRAELKLQSTLLADANAKLNDASSPTRSTLKTVGPSNIGHLQSQLLHYKAFGELIPEQDVESMQQEIDDLKKKLAVATAKSRVQEKPEVVRAIEQSYRNQVSILKSRLGEAESRYKEEMFRAEEERRLSKENEAERSKSMERLRKEREEAIDAQNALRDKLIAVQMKFAAKASKEVSTHSPKSPLSSSEVEVPSNVKRLRNELALARARLAAGRDQSRALDSADRPLADDLEDKLPLTPSSPDKSLASNGSSWAPPGKSSVEVPSTSAGNESSPTSVLALKQHYENRVPSSIDTAKRQTAKVYTAQGKPKRPNAGDLNRKLEASRKRLEDASAKLDGLENSAKMFSAPAAKIFRKDDSPRTCGGVDQVVQSLSGNLEVEHRRFADV